MTSNIYLTNENLGLLYRVPAKNNINTTIMILNDLPLIISHKVSIYINEYTSRCTCKYQFQSLIELSTTKFNKINLSLIYMYRKTHISILPITVLTSHLLHVF